jgi:hypothetical protein
MDRRKRESNSVSAGTSLRAEALGLGKAYLAMHYFIDGYWETGGGREGSVTLLRLALGRARWPMHLVQYKTADPAFWSDWMRAVEKARSEGVPGQL